MIEQGEPPGEPVAEPVIEQGEPPGEPVAEIPARSPPSPTSRGLDDARWRSLLDHR